MHRWLEGLCVREPRVSRGIYPRLGEAFQALLTRRQPGHRCRSDAAELRAAEAASRRMAGAAVVNGFGQAADLPGVHRGGVWVSQAPRAAGHVVARTPDLLAWWTPAAVRPMFFRA